MRQLRTPAPTTTYSSVGSDDQQCSRQNHLGFPSVIVSHGNQPDPIFWYGNHLALTRWETTWDAFTALPSRKSAEPMHRDERQALLEEAEQNGFVTGLSGIRITSTGKPFRIDDVILWNISDEQGTYIGQAATYQQWSWMSKR